VILKFGKYKGKEVRECPVPYLQWLATHNSNPAFEFNVPDEIEAEAILLLEELGADVESWRDQA
jgi:hypothetical protein